MVAVEGSTVAEDCRTAVADSVEAEASMPVAAGHTEASVEDFSAVVVLAVAGSAGDLTGASAVGDLAAVSVDGTISASASDSAGTHGPFGPTGATGITQGTDILTRTTHTIPATRPMDAILTARTIATRTGMATGMGMVRLMIRPTHRRPDTHIRKQALQR